MLAEPNLTAMSGETASFLAGGEIPIPVAQAGSSTGAITVEFKPFGVSLDFTPTVLADNRISLKVRPEVSEVDANNSVTTGGVKVPGPRCGASTRRSSCRAGRASRSAGCFRARRPTPCRRFRAGRLPIIGRLFSSKNFQDNKTEVVVIVTPYIVQPTGPASSSRRSTPSRGRAATWSSRCSATSADLLSGDTPRLVGAAGFVY